MKRLVLFLLTGCSFFAKAQVNLPQVIDSFNNKPLAYAIVLYQNKQKVTYTDVNGFFNISKDSLKINDSVIVQYLGYEKYALKSQDIKNGLVIRMVRQEQSLQPIIVSNCPRFEAFTLNKKTGNIKQYIGPGPETRLIIMSRYYNNTGRNAFLKTVSLLFDKKSSNIQIPVRLRWYEWDNDSKMPGKELTDTSIIVYPYKEGWNDFEMPDKTIPFPKDWVVFGFEFIYPPDYAAQYKELKTDDQRIKWLNDLDHRWSLSMQNVDNADEGAFYILNNNNIAQYSKKFERYYMRPAAKFTILFCKE